MKKLIKIIITTILLSPVLFNIYKHSGELLNPNRKELKNMVMKLPKLKKRKSISVLIPFPIFKVTCARLLN